MRYSSMLAVALLLGGLNPLAAQSVPLLGPGSHVRLVTPIHRGTFEVMEWTASTLVVWNRRSGEEVAIPLASVERLDVHRGWQPRGRSMLRGMGIGLLAGGGAGAVIGLASGGTGSGDWALSASESAILLGVFVGGSGALLGGVIGALAPDSRWEPVELPVKLSVVPHRDRGVGMVVSRDFW